MQQKTIKVSKKKLRWLVLILIILGIWWAFQRPRYYPMPFMSSGYDSAVSVSPGETGSADMMMVENEIAPDYPRYRGNPDITDDRQFLKTNYSANIQTRDVKTIIRNIKGIVTVAGGRMDNIQESEKFGYIGFVIPKSNFDAFRDEIESLTYAKLITINVSSQNLLSQKQIIEDQINNATSSLASLEKQLTTLTTGYNQAIGSLNKELGTISSQLTVLQATFDANANEAERLEIQKQISTLTQRESTIKQNISNENKAYNAQRQNLNIRIDQAKNLVDNTEKKDVDFGNDIETVTGNISVNWVSVWEVIKIFTPIHPGWIILILVLVAYKPLALLGVIPKIELV